MALPSCLFVLAALFGKSKKVHLSHRKTRKRKYCEVKVDFDEVKVGSARDAQKWCFRRLGPIIFLRHRNPQSVAHPNRGSSRRAGTT